MPPWPRSPYKLPPVAPRFFWGSCNLVLFVMQFANLNKSADVGFLCLPTKCIYDLDMIQLCTVIRYPSGQDGGISPARDYPLYLARKPYNKFFIFSQDDQILALFFFYEFMDLKFISVTKHPKKKP